MNVTAAIDGDGPSGIHAGSIMLNATDTSSIEAVTGAAALAVSFGGGTAVSVAVGVALAENVIQNDIEAYIAHANNLTTTGTGAINVSASETASIDSTTFAAAVAIAVSEKGLAAAVGVLEATNTLENIVAAYISDSGSIGSAGAVTVSASDTGVISADTFSLSVAIGLISVGVGTGSGNNAIADDVSAYVDSSTITATSSPDMLGTASFIPSPTTVVDNRIIFANDTTLTEGQAVVYHQGIGNSSIGLIEGQTYYVKRTTDPKVIQLANDQGAVIPLTPSDKIAITATSTPNITTTSTAVAVALGLGAGVAVFDATTTVRGTTEAYVQDSVLTAADNTVRVTSTSTETLSPLVRGGAGGLIAVGVMLSEATVEGSTLARLGGQTTVTANSLVGHGQRYQHGHASYERRQRRSGGSFACQDRCHVEKADRGLNSHECPNHPG